MAEETQRSWLNPAIDPSDKFAKAFDEELTDGSRLDEALVDVRHKSGNIDIPNLELVEEA